MKKSVIKFGSYSALTAAILFTLSLILGKNLDFSTQEVLGYFSIVASLIFIFFGIKHYRDHFNNGIISMGKAILIGVLISLFASLAIGIVDAIYLKYINPDFTEQYMNYTLTALEKKLSPEAFELKKAELEMQMQTFANPVFGGLVMFVTVFIIGFIITLIAALILKRNQ